MAEVSRAAQRMLSRQQSRAAYRKEIVLGKADCDKARPDACPVANADVERLRSEVGQRRARIDQQLAFGTEAVESLQTMKQPFVGKAEGTVTASACRLRAERIRSIPTDRCEKPSCKSGMADRAASVSTSRAGPACERWNSSTPRLSSSRRTSCPTAAGVTFNSCAPVRSFGGVPPLPAHEGHSDDPAPSSFDKYNLFRRSRSSRLSPIPSGGISPPTERALRLQHPSKSGERP